MKSYRIVPGTRGVLVDLSPTRASSKLVRSGSDQYENYTQLWDSLWHIIDDDGKFVTFESRASNIKMRRTLTYPANCITVSFT